MPPLVVPPWPALTVCDHGQGVALPDRLSHIFTRRQHSWSWTPGFTAYYTAPQGVNLSTAQVNIRVDSCHSPATSARAHEVGHPHTYKPHSQKQFTSFGNISGLSLVRCFVPKSEEFVSEGDLHPQLVVADRLLEPQSTGSQCALLCPSPFCSLWTVPHWSQCAVESGRLYPSLWRTPKLPSALLLRGCVRAVLLRRCWWRQCFASSSKP